MSTGELTNSGSKVRSAVDPARCLSVQLFQPGKNCWRTGTAAHAAPLVDCANFYRAVHEAVVAARRTIFIVGWEIDSGTRLLRGEDEKRATAPSVISDLLACVSERNPGLKIYLLRWEASVAFKAEREFLTELSWTRKTPLNVHICTDDTSPIGGCQHQKVILVDDELVFCGGMDIARQRWDEREHRIHETERRDSNGSYGPYHDVQLVMDGPVVAHFSKLVRDRWREAAGYEAEGLRPHPTVSRGKAASWPGRAVPEFQDITCAISRTCPSEFERSAITEIRQMYLDLIDQAEDFIYIENQFLTSIEIAKRINRRLKIRPAVRALLVSSYDPQGFFETEGMWAGRIEFQKVLEEGIAPERVRIVSSGMRDRNGTAHYKRIHSKILVVDDRYATIASSNLTRRSFHLDTECDVTIAGCTEAQRRGIACFRNDLIAEHSGLTMNEVEEVLRSTRFLDRLIGPICSDRYRLTPTKDEQFPHLTLKPIVLPMTDPGEPFLEAAPQPRNPRGYHFVRVGLTLLLIAGLYFLYRHSSAPDSVATVRGFLEEVRESTFALPAVILAFVLAGFVLFPMTVLSLLTAAAFGAVRGPFYGMIGALVSGTLMFWIGRSTGLRRLRKLAGDRLREIEVYFQRSGVLGVAVFRLLPVAPYSIVNLAAGISNVRYGVFIAGTFLGLLPGFIAKGLVGDSLVQVFTRGSGASYLQLLTGVSVWAGLIWVSFVIGRRMQRRVRQG